MSNKITLSTIMVILLLGASSSYADIVTLDASTQGQGNKGLSFRPWTDSSHSQTANFTITARTKIDKHSPFDTDASGSIGTVSIYSHGHGNKKHGAGVQDAKGHGGKKGQGSKSISSGGSDQELIFTYDQSVYLNSIDVFLGDIDFGHGGSHKDDPVIFLKFAGSDTYDMAITETDIYSAFTYDGPSRNKYGMVEFGSFTSLTGLSENTAIAGFKIRETHGQIYVNGVSNGVSSSIGSTETVPEPATLCLLVFGSLAFMIRRRRLAALAS